MLIFLKEPYKLNTTEAIDSCIWAQWPACHRIYQFDVHGQVPNVVRLQIHLPGQHMVVFDSDENMDTIFT